MTGVRANHTRTASDYELQCRERDCENYPQWDADCRAQALPVRSEQHLRERKKVFERSVYACLNSFMQILVLYYDKQKYAHIFRHQHQNHVCSECSAIDCQEEEHRNSSRGKNKKCFNCEIAFEIAPEIMANALRFSDQNRMSWPGIQISQCKNLPETYQEFVAKAINHQDQHSWGPTANDLYVPAIDAALAMFRGFANLLPTIFKHDRLLRNAVIELLGCGLALFMLTGTTKFKRTKAKPVVRSRTLRRSIELRNAILRCCPSITIDIWIDQETRKQSGGRFDSDGNSLKRNVCEEVHLKTRMTCLDLFVEKYKTVCRLLGVPLPQPFLNQIIKDSQPPPKPENKSANKGKGKKGKRKKQNKKKKSQQIPLPLPTIINSKNNSRSKPIIITSTSISNCSRIGRDFQPSNDFVIENRERRRTESNDRRQRSRAIYNNKHHYNNNNNNINISNNDNNGNGSGNDCELGSYTSEHYSDCNNSAADLEMQRHLRERQELQEESQRLSMELADVRRLYDMEMRERQRLYEENKRLKMQLANNMRNTMMSNQNHHLMPRSVPCYTTNNNNNNNINNNANAQQLQQQQQWCPTLTNTHPMVHTTTTTTTTTNMANSASAAATSSPNVAESMSAIIDEDMTFPTIGNNNNSRVEGVPEELPLGSMNSGGVLSSNLDFNFNVNLGLNSYLGSVSPFMDRGYSVISSGFCPPI